MRAQTSMEFLIITGAIAALILFSITQYGKVSAQGMRLENVSPQIISVPPSMPYTQAPVFQAYMPPYTSPYAQGDLRLAAYGCMNGTVSVSISSSSIAFSMSAGMQAIYGAWTYSDNFTAQPGLDHATIRYSIDCGKGLYNGSQSVSTMSSQAGAATYSAYIYGRNESVAYNASSQPIDYVSSSSHCTYEDFFYNPYPIWAQCSTSDAWEYRVYSSSCSSNGGSTTLTACLVPYQSGYSLVSSSTKDPRYLYLANLDIGGAAQLYSSISSSSASSNVYYLGNAIGTASVANVTDPGLQANYALSSGNGYAYVNSTYLGQYEQAYNTMYGLLSYYNKTSVSYAVESQITQAVSTYNYYEGKLVSAQNASGSIKCRVYGNTMTCPASEPFYYVIDASIPAQYFGPNQTLSYEGSVIRVSS